MCIAFSSAWYHGPVSTLFLQVGDMDALDAIFVPVGGGGLIAGIAAFVKALKPHVQVRNSSK